MVVNYFEKLSESMDEESEILDEIKTKKQKARERDLKEILNKSKLNRFELEEYMLG